MIAIDSVCKSTVFTWKAICKIWQRVGYVVNDAIILSGHVVSVTSLHGEHSHSLKMTIKLLQEKQSFYISPEYLTTDFIRTTLENEIARDLYWNVY